MKRKINLNRPKISADEIAQRQDFDSVLKANATATKPFFKKRGSYPGLLLQQLLLYQL